jgi:transglutaminase-like putative cysteine protease
MHIRVGYEIVYHCPQPTPMLLMLQIHHSRIRDIVEPDNLVTCPYVPLTAYRDVFGNWCSRLVAPAGTIELTATAILEDDGRPDPYAPQARQVDVQDLPDDVLMFLLGSRYCETDRLSAFAWEKFGRIAPGWARVQAICDFVHRHLTFGYEHGRPTKTALDAFNEGTGVCRDFTHLAVVLCRAINIPARYCTGYLSDVGEPPPWDPMDFAAWFEAYLDGAWYTFDPRHNRPRVGRVLIARGRDAADVAIANTFGACTLERFIVRTDEVAAPAERTLAAS